MDKDELLKILVELDYGAITSTKAQEKILMLFNSSKKSELLLRFINWWISKNKRRDTQHSLEEIVAEFIKNEE
jgi:hypothetical protein